MDDDGPPPEKCGGCAATSQVNWSPMWGWLCTRCQWQHTETFFYNLPVTILPSGIVEDPGARAAA